MSRNRRRDTPQSVKKEWALLNGLLPGAHLPITCWWCEAGGFVYWEVREDGTSRVRLLAGFEWDHMTPISRGGPDDADNLDPCCMRCNRKKGARTIEEYWRHVWPHGMPTPADYVEPEREPDEDALREAQEERAYYAALDQLYEDMDMHRRAAMAPRGNSAWLTR